MDSQLEHIVFAAFLHDIGKVMQRAEVPVDAGSETLMHTTGPSRDGHSTHYHVQWTSEFFESFLGPVGLPNRPSLEQTASRIAFKHHNPSTPWEWIVAEADRLSSGMERGEQQYQRNSHKRKRMVPVRCLLSMGDPPQPPLSYAPLCKLTSRDMTCNPILMDSNDENLVPLYQALWGSFQEDWRGRRCEGVLANLAYLNALFERYFWSMPASTIDEIPDNSIYEHSQSVAALAACLYQYHEQTSSLDEVSIKDRTNPKYVLAHADISGIQKYIFAIAHAGGGKVAKRLRARSFMVSRIPQILAMQIITELELPFFNIILSAGGKFHLLLPHTPRTLAVLRRKEQECQQWLHQQFQGLLTLNLAYVEMRGEDFMNKRVGKKFSEAAEALVQKKFQPLHTLLMSESGWNPDAFVLPDAKIETESPMGHYDIEPRYREDDLGRQLPKAECLAIYPNTEDGDFPVLGWSFSVATKAREFAPGYTTIVSFKRGAEDSSWATSVPVFYEYRASHVPQRDGEILSFEEIGETAQGRKALGYLKADVDNLGYLLQHGLDWNAIGWTLSKMTSFSRSMEFFFAGRVENLLEEEEFKTIYTVFSGGDDVFLVGPWNTVHDFAFRLREEFEKYTKNSNLTLSAGITIQRPFTPVWLASGQTDGAEKAAKTEEAFVGAPVKNQLCTFNHLIPWNEAFYVFNEIDQVDEWLQTGELSASMLQQFIYFAELAKAYHAGDRHVEGLRYLPMLSYSASRNLKKDSPVKDWIPRLQDVDGKAIRHLGFIANYCLNLNRKS